MSVAAGAGSRVRELDFGVGGDGQRGVRVPASVGTRRQVQVVQWVDRAEPGAGDGGFQIAGHVAGPLVAVGGSLAIDLSTTASTSSGVCWPSADMDGGSSVTWAIMTACGVGLAKGTLPVSMW